MIPEGLRHLLDHIKADSSIRLPLINLYGPPACGKTFVFNEMANYIGIERCYLHTWPSNEHSSWTWHIEGMILIFVEAKGIPEKLNDVFITINKQCEYPRIVLNVSHWVTESEGPIQGALNYEIKR